MTPKIEQTNAGTMISWPEQGAQSRVIRIVPNQSAVIETTTGPGGVETYRTKLFVEIVGEASSSKSPSRRR